MKIKKIYSTITKTVGKILSSFSSSTTDTYSCNYVNNLHTYSLDEVQIGTWIDKKPLYRKCFNLGSQTAGETVVVDNISNLNVDNMVKIYGRCSWDNSGNSVSATFPSSLATNSGDYSIIGFVESNKIKLWIGYSRVAITNTVLVLEYTKTTD